MSLCPHCGLPLAPVSGPGSLLGYRLFGPLDDPHALPEALEAALPLPIFETHGPWMDLG